MYIIQNTCINITLKSDEIHVHDITSYIMQYNVQYTAQYTIYICVSV